MNITDEMVKAFVDSYDEGCCNDSSADWCCTRHALARVAPLIAAQALRDDAAKIERWSSGTEDAVDRLLAAVRAAVPDPLRDDWRTDAADLVSEIEVAWARAQ